MGKLLPSSGDSERYNLLDRVAETVGHNRDVVVPEELFEESLDYLERSNRTYVDRIYPEAKVYRDERPYGSLHVTDFRECQEKEGIGAHLEHFNPDHHPFLHVMDVILWHLRDKLETSDVPTLGKPE